MREFIATFHTHLAALMTSRNLNACLRLADAHNCRVVLETKTAEGLRQSVRWLKCNG